MTVLVLENADLLALASRTPPPSALTGKSTPVEAEPISRPELDQFHFSFGSHQLDTSATKVLRQHGQYLKAHPEQKVYVTGHSDNQGPAAYNRSLSRLRATAAAKVLRAEGVRENQITVLGVGSDQPYQTGNHELNRRVELQYLSDAVAQSN